MERAWLDVNLKVSLTYKSYFEYLEIQEGINFENANIKFIIHYLFLSRINEDLDRFTSAWNSHRLSTENNRTPHEILYINRALGSTVLPLDEVLQNNNNVEANNDDLWNDNLIPSVIVEPTICSLNEQNYNIFKDQIFPLTLNNNLNSVLPIINNAIVVMNELLINNE